MEVLKNVIRWIVFPFIPEYIRATEGTLKYQVLEWLYGAESKSGPYITWPDPPQDCTGE